LEDFRYITLRTIFFQIISVIAIFIFVKTKADVLKYFLIPVFISLLNTVVNTNYILRFIKFQAIKSKLQIKRHMKPLLLLFSVMLFTSIYNLLDTTLLGFLAKIANVGYYAVASKINRIPLSFVMVLAPVMLPRISVEFKNENYIEIKRLIAKTLQFVIFLGVPIMVGIYISAPEIILLISGRDFLPAIETLRIMSPIALIIGITTIFSTQLLIPMGKDKHLLYAVMFGTASSLILNFFLIPILKHNGAAISNLVAEIVVLTSCYLYAFKSIKIKIPFKQILFTLISCVPFAGIIFITRQFFSSPLLVLLTTIVISVLYYLTIQILFLKNLILIEVKDTLQKKMQSNIKF
jgi:O-antigen/teichoic acid export membrane protein